MKHNIFLLFLINFHFLGWSQSAIESLPPNYINTIQFQEDSAQGGNPILRLGERIKLTFDDIIGDEANYYYTIEHYNYDWIPSDLAKSEYMDGFDDTRILNYRNSYNTLLSFTHYELQIPNEDTKGLKVSGNYMIKIFNDNRELVFSRKFMVYEPIAKIGVTIKRSRDLNYLDTKQVVNFTVDSPDLLLKNPDKTVNVLILQNKNLKTAIGNIIPRFSMGNQLIYRHDQETSFWGGNEYLQFDSKDIRSSTIDINYVEIRELYHHHLFPDRARVTEPYTYNPDINGKFVVRSLQGEDPDIEAEYVWMHFKLRNYDSIQDGELHIYGAFNNFELDKSTKLTFNEESGMYENARLFKQGFYNYKYVLLRPDGNIDEGFISGNHDETENHYDVLVYYKNLGARYDRLIGIGTANSVNITN